MSLSKINPRQRPILRWHGWLLMLWACTIGLVTSSFLLHVFKVHSMAWRYAFGAGAVYFIGFVFGGRWYAQWWNAQPRTDPDFPLRASTEDQVKYDQEDEVVRKKFSRFDGLGDFGGGGDDPLSAILLVVGLICVAFFLLLFMGYLPYLATDFLAGYLAEIVLEFVIGGLLMRRIARPRDIDEYWVFIVRKTWLAGLLLMVVVAVVGYLIQLTNPEAKTLFQALH